MNLDEIAALLPWNYRSAIDRSPALKAALESIDELLSPVEDHLDDLERIFDPMRAPAAFVLRLAEWVGFGDLVEGALARRHQHPVSWPRLVAAASSLSEHRGTRHGLIEFLSLATATGGFEVDDSLPDPETGRVRPFHFEVLVPAAAAPKRRLIEAIVKRESPAHTTFETRFAVHVESDQ